MKKQVQYKFQVQNSFKNNAKTKGVEFSPVVKHTYTYFEAPNSDDCFFVVLRLKDSEGVQKLDMKIRTNDTGEWEHFESKIDNLEQVQSILERLNCKPIFTFHKHRQSWTNKFIRFDLDTTKELGSFLEVKFDLTEKKRVEQFLQDFGLDPTKHDKRSVIEIYKNKYNK